MGEKPGQVAEQEVDGQGTLVRFVDDDRVVATQQAVLSDGGQQQAVGHDREQSVVAGLIGKADAIADRAAEGDVQLLGDALGDRPGSDTTRLGVGDARWAVCGPR